MKFPKIFLLAIFLLASTFLSAQGDNLYGLWSRKAGSLGQAGNVFIHKMIKDSQSNVYICGSYAGFVNFSENTCVLECAKGAPYTGIQSYTTVTDQNGLVRDSKVLRSDGFIVKYDSDGNFVWNIRLGTEVSDHVANIELADNEESLIFFSIYGNASYADPTDLKVTSSHIQYGNQTEAQKEVLDYNVSRPTYQNFHLGKVSTTDGSKIFGKYLGYGADGNDINIPNVDDKYLWLNNITITLSGEIMVLGLKGWPLKKFISTYKISDGTLINYVHNKTEEELNAHVTKLTKNKSAGIYTLLRFIPHNFPAGKGVYLKYLVKVNPVTMHFDTISRISLYRQEDNPIEYPNFYANSGIVLGAIDVDNANKHLFVVGNYQKTFNYVSGNEAINFAGGITDGIIVCVDPTSPTGIPKWIVKLSSAGAEKVSDCQFDANGNGGLGSLKVVGQISDIPVNFNPLGTPMSHKSNGKSSGFYAEYDLNGKCLKVELFGNKDEQVTQALDLSNNKVTMFGNFSGSPFDLDPSGRLTPLRTGQTSNYIASYSTDPGSTQKMLYDASYSAADNFYPNYDLASHYVLPCIQLGDKNDLVTPQQITDYSPAGYPIGVVNPNYDGLVSFVTNADGTSEATVKFVNDRPDSAYLAAWIDFNGNGKFDVNEVSVVKVDKNVTSGTEKLKWTTPPKHNLMGMTSFMRIRLTSEELDGTWSGGEAMDGEVEDHQVKFPPRITITKESKATNKTYASVDTARLGDTITYKINVQTEVFPVTLYDSVPVFVDYVPNSATHSGVYNNGEVRWNVTAANTIFEFKVVPNSQPNYPETPNDKNLYNVAIVASATDTATSSDNCSMDSIYIKELKITAVDDYNIAISGIEKKLDVLANDKLDPCDRSTLDEVKIAVPPKKGTAQFNTVDSTILYQSAMKFTGLDSLDYSIKCGMATSTARAYILVNNPLSLYYVACPEAKVEIGFQPIAGVVYNWYANKTGGSIIWANTNKKEITKDNSGADEVWWVEPVYKGITYPRQEVRVEQSQYCGNTDVKGCYATGTSIYYEDFGGNDLNAPRFSLTPLAPGLTDLNFCPEAGNCGGAYGYSFEKWSTIFKNSMYFRDGGSDHTHPNDSSKGYYMYIDPAPSQLEAKLYVSIIKGLCENVKLNFTVWASDMHVSPTAARPKIEMLIMDAKTKDTIVKSGEFVLIRDPNLGDPTPLLYHQYGFDFSIPAGTDSILFSIINKELNNIGNDWVLDDIEIKVCLPPIEFTPVLKDTAVCADSDLKVSGKFTDDGTFGDDLVYRWEFQKEGTTTWATVAGTAGACATGKVNSELKLQNILAANGGEYRLVVGNTSTIEKENCRAAKSFKLHVKENSLAADVIVSDTAVYYGTNATITAKSTGITNPVFNWYKSQTDVTPIFTGATLIRNNIILDSTYYVSVQGEDVCENVISNRKPVHIKIIGSPEIILLDSCSFQPKLSVDKQMIGATYKWEFSTDNTTFNVLAGVTTEICKVTKEGYYRVTVSYSGTVVVKVKKLVVEKELKMLNRVWYKTFLN